jgi:hypothetical protein
MPINPGPGRKARSIQTKPSSDGLVYDCLSCVLQTASFHLESPADSGHLPQLLHLPLVSLFHDQAGLSFQLIW